MLYLFSRISRLRWQSMLDRVGVYVFLFSLSLFLFVGIKTSFTQTKEIDSLKSVAIVSSGSNKAITLMLIADKYRVMNYDSVVKYATAALDYSIIIDDKGITIRALSDLAYINISLGNYARAVRLYKRAKVLSIRENNQNLLAQIFLNLGRYNTKLSNYAAVINSLDTALNIINTYNIAHLKPNVYLAIGRLYLLIHELQVAKYYANIAIDYSLEEKDNSNYIKSLLLIGDIYLKQNKSDSSLLFFNKALNIAKITDNKHLIQIAYRKMADFYMESKDFDITNQYIDSSIVYCRELTLTNELAALITYKAYILSKGGNFIGTLEYNLEALKLRKTSGHKLSICSSLINIGSNYTELGEYEKAKQYLNEGLMIAVAQKSIYYLDYAYKKLSMLYRAKGDYKEALHYTDLREKYKDSMVFNRSNKEVLFFRSRYELERQKTISEKIKLKKKSNEQIFLFIVASLFVLVIMLLIRFVYLRRRSSKEIIKLSRIIETTTQAVIMVNSKGKILYVNNGLLNILGFSDREELLGKLISEFANPKLEVVLKDTIIPAITKTGHWEGEMMNMKKDKSLFFSEVICSVLSEQDGNPDFFVAVFNDISIRKKAEADLRAIRENLEKTVKTQDRMFSIIAHDLTGPFSSILGLSELMATEYDSYGRDDHIKFSQLIYSSSKHTFDLLTNLLQWSRTQLGNIDLKFEKTNIYDLVSENVELAKLLLIKKEIIFDNKVSSNIFAYIDYNTISVVVRNLISNAVKFTHRGGNIIVDAYEIGGNIKIVVSDSGVGIEKEDIDSLFDIGNNKTQRGTEDEKGTGLGLVLCKEFTELNNGTIEVESVSGEGSKFIITIPSSE